LGGTEDYGWCWAELEINNIAVLLAEFLEPEPWLADAGSDGLGAWGELGAVGVEFPFLLELKL